MIGGWLVSIQRLPNVLRLYAAAAPATAIISRGRQCRVEGNAEWKASTPTAASIKRNSQRKHRHKSFSASASTASNEFMIIRLNNSPPGAIYIKSSSAALKSAWPAGWLASARRGAEDVDTVCPLLTVSKPPSTRQEQPTLLSTLSDTLPPNSTTVVLD